MTIPNRFSVLLLGVFITSSAVAKDSLLTEEDLFHGMPVVRSVTGLEQRLSRTPATVTIIDRAMIEASGALYVVDLLRLVPGFQVYAVNANRPVVVNHGQGRDYLNRMEVMVDGRSVYNAIFSTVDWQALGLTVDDIDHIEVIRGPNVQTQGSNAFMGSINIVTREPLRTEGNSISTTQGSRNTEMYSFRHNGEAGLMDYWVSVGRMSNEGFDTGLEDDDSNVPLPINDGGHMTHFSYRGTYTPTLTNTLDFQFGYSKGTFGVGPPDEPEEIFPRHSISHYQSLTWNHRFDASNSMKLSAYHNYHDYTQDNYASYEANEFASLFGPHDAFALNLAVANGETHRYDLDAEFTHQLNPGRRLIWNLGMRSESLRSLPLLFDGENYQTEKLYRLSANLEEQLSTDLTLNLGAMVEYTDITGSYFSPRIGLNYQLNPENSLRVSASRAYRNPSLLEIYEATAIALPDFSPFNGVIFNQISFPNLNLNPEKITAFEVGHLLQSSDLRLFLDSRVFVERIEQGIDHYHTPYVEDLGVYQYDDRVRSYDNIAEWRTHGFETQLKYEPIKGTWFHLGYGYARTKGDYNKGQGYENWQTELEGRTPKHTLSMLASQRITDSLNVSLGYYNMSSVQWLGASPVDAIERIDLRLAKVFEQLKVEVIMQNLSSDYSEFEPNNRYDNRMFARLSLEF